MGSRRSGIAEYGEVHETYKGRGILITPEGHEIKCSFEAGQIESGEIRLLCRMRASKRAWSRFPMIPASEFRGTTSTGYEVRAKGNMHEINYLSAIVPTKSPMMLAAYHVDELELTASSTATAASSHYGITNFRFYGSGASFGALPFKVETNQGQVEITITRLSPYVKTVERLSTLKGIAVTALITIEHTGDCPREFLDTLVTDLCRILSVARGTKVQWLYRDDFDANESHVKRYHGSHYTAPYGPFEVIDSRGSGANPDVLTTFVTVGYSRYKANKGRFGLDRGTIEAFLDAKSESDHLELRGVKVAVALEMLLDHFLSSNESGRWLIAEREAEALSTVLSTAVSEILHARQVSSDIHEAISNLLKMKGLFRTSLSQQIKLLLAEIGMRSASDERRLLIECRNSLVHTGRFYCDQYAAGQRSGPKPLLDGYSEYAFMMNFLDRVMVHIFGYSGLYLDWRCVPPTERLTMDKHNPYRVE